MKDTAKSVQDRETTEEQMRKNRKWSGCAGAKHGRNRRGLAAFVLVAMLAVLCSCGARPHVPSESVPAASESATAQSFLDLTQPEGGRLDLAYLSGKTGETEQALPGTEMSEEQILHLAWRLLDRGKAWNDWKNKSENWALNMTEATTKTGQDGREITVYPLLDFTDEQQMRKVMQSIFSVEYVQSEWERLFEQNWGPFCVDEKGSLLADPQYAGRVEFWYLPQQMRILGAIENKIYLEVPGQFNSETTEVYRLLLVREQGRWVLGGWEWDMQWDNDYIALPPALEQAASKADESTDMAVRIAWKLGESLKKADQQAVNHCFSLMEEPRYDWEGEYPLKDISGLKMNGFDVQINEREGESQVCLELDVQQAGKTPFQEGKHRYLIWVYETDGNPLYPKGCICMIRPESTMDTNGPQAVSQEEASGLMDMVYMVRAWYSTEEFKSCTENIGSHTLSYLLIRMEQEGVIGAEGATFEQLQWAAKAYLGIEDYRPSPQVVEAVCYEENGRCIHREMCGLCVGPENPQWFSSISKEANEYCAELCISEDAVGLVEKERMQYVFGKTEDGVFQLKCCTKTSA